jgi:hypothetical protein
VIQRSGDAKAADTREGPGDLRSEEQISEANRAGGRPDFGSDEAGVEDRGVPENVSFSGQVVADKLKKFIDADGAQKQWLPDADRNRFFRLFRHKSLK